MHRLTLNSSEIEVLDRQDSSTEFDGGWQGLLVCLQRGVDRVTGEIVLEGHDLARIARYAFDYGRGGWESRLREIFGRTLGPNLGR
jgi:hypothetical protein